MILPHSTFDNRNDTASLGSMQCMKAPIIHTE